MERDPFKEYIEEKEPGKRDKAYAWHTAMGLQDVDGLKPSNYLVDTAIKNIEGEMTLDEAENLLHSYYEERTESSDDRTEEADKVALNIAKFLSKLLELEVIEPVKGHGKGKYAFKTNHIDS